MRTSFGRPFIFVLLMSAPLGLADNENSTTTTSTLSSSFTTSSATSSSSTTTTLTMSSTTTSSNTTSTTETTTTGSSSTSSMTSTTSSSTSSLTLSTTSNFTTTTGTTTSRTNTSLTVTTTTPTTATSTLTSSTGTSSSVTSTISTTTTTTRVYRLYIDEAQVFPSHLNVIFNYPARLANENDTWSCDDLWEEDSVKSFGVEPSCTLSDDQRSLQVALGKLTRLVVGDFVMMKFGVLLPHGFIVVEPTELSAVVITKAPLVPLRAVLLAADAFQACSVGRFSLAASTGFARRAPVIHWQLGNHTDPALQSVLQPTLDEANELMLQVLEIPPEIFQFGTLQVDVDVSEVSEMDDGLEIEVMASISNWQAEAEDVSVEVTVFHVETPLLQISPKSLKNFNISNYEEVEMAVDVFPAVQCINSSDVPPSLSVQWEYWQRNEKICIEFLPTSSGNMSLDNMSNDSNDSNVTENLSNDSNSSNISGEVVERPCIEWLWQRLENTSFRDLNRRPGSLRLPAFSFQPNSSHRFRAVSTFEGYEGSKPSVVFTVNVRPSTTPVAVISGPSTVSALCPFNLSASESYDASVPKDDETSRLEFSWSCMVGMVIGYNETELLEAEECNLTITDDWTQNPVIEAEGDLLEEGSYTFRVKVRRVNLHEQNRTSESPPASGPPDPRGPDGAPVRPDPESPHGEGWWVVHVRRRAIPVVQLQVPWADGDEVSVARNLEPAIAHVSGSMACPIPNDWAWHWVLIDDAYVLALMKTTVRFMGASLAEVATADFKGDLLVPANSYTYALVAHNNSDWVKQLVPGRSMLSDLIAAGALVYTSPPFRANGPPREGLMELVPRSGEGLLTPFAVSSFGWRDEEESLLSYSFFRFPLAVSGVSADGNGGIIFDEGWTGWSLPKIEWRNTSSSMYFRKQGGLTLQTWESSNMVSDLLMAVGSYFIVVRVRDPQGGEGIAAVLGPVVVEPVNVTDVTAVLQASFVSRDADHILNAVDAVLSTATVSTESVLNALEVATSLLDPTPEALEKMSQILVSTVKTGGPGGMPPKTELLRAAEILQMCLDLAVASPEQGIGSTAAIAMLEALSSVHEAGRSPDPNATEELANFTRRTGALASSMAKAALAKLQVGDSSFVSGAVEGKGTNLQLVSSLASALTESGLQVQRLYMPPGVLTTSRRLQASACSDVGISAIYWQRSNPYTWASSSKGVNQYVSADATVAVLEFEMCGSPLMFNESIPDRTMRLRAITLPARTPPPVGFRWEVYCAKWSESEEAWLLRGIEVQKPVYWDDVEVSCMIYEGASGMSLTAFFLPEEVTTTSTTVEWTHPTYTTFEIPPLPPVYVVSCNESLLPEPPKGQGWNCTKPGEGQECRATCEGYPDMMASVTCLKGASSLEWFVTNVCPIFTTTTLDLTVDHPADHAILGSVLIFVWIVVFSCSAGICALMAYGLYKFSMNESKSQVSAAPSIVVTDTEASEDEEEDMVDPAFLQWAKNWAENPTVESAVLERKVKASKSQEALLDQASSILANENEAGEDAATSSAFTRTAEIEFTEDWKADLEALLRDHQIPLDGEGRLYYVVNTVREILQVKDLQSLHKVNFPLTIHMQEAPPQVEKADGFYFWQVEWGALKGSSISTKKEDQNVDAQPPEEEAEDGGAVHQMSQRQIEHDDLMKQWSQHSLRRSSRRSFLLHPRVPRSQDGKTRRAGARAPRALDHVVDQLQNP
ncbi:unnamed protein product [Durusdinium trenchii]|uniref:GPS domain-containing protein n=1 Tax=Durusdinium trenchii TaxID=1381693 RepID=A0ABP0MNY7_9DINO